MPGFTLRYRFALSLIRLKNRWSIGRVEGLGNLPPKGVGYIAAGNHRSFADGTLVGGTLACARNEPVHMVTYEEIFRLPVIGTVLRWTQCINVGRPGTPESLVAFLREGRRFICDERQMVGLFPEGRVRLRESPDLGRGHVGAALLALETGAPVVPVATRGSVRVFDVARMECPFERRCVTLRVGGSLDFSREKRLYDGGTADVRRVVVAGVTTMLMREIAALTGQSYPHGAKALERLEALKRGEDGRASRARRR